MATEAPDPRAFKSWEDAFQHPMPVVHRLEQQLRGHLNEKQEKLRALVGVSYRDLLGTAERIIEMDEQMQQAETILGNLGQKCNSRMLSRISGNYAKLEHEKLQANSERYTFASQLAALHTCQVLIRRMLTDRGSALLMAKVLVISRLLHRSLSQLPDAPPFVEDARVRLGSLRRRLLSRIDQSMASPDVDTTQLLDDMCAFSLATSSTPTDILRHFHHIRHEAITGSIQNQHASHIDILKAFKLYMSTLRVTASIVPGRLADQLCKLKARPLLQDPGIRALEELNFDVHERWLAEDVKHFTPWPRHDELQKLEADRLTKAWGKQALTAFLNGMQLALSTRNDFKALTDLRKALLESVLSSRAREAGFDLRQILDHVRSALTFQLIKLSRNRASNLHLVTSEISGILADWVGEGSNDLPRSLWDHSLLFMETGSGAKDLIEAVIDRRNGRTNPVVRVMRAYQNWASFVEDAYRVVKQMKDTKWDEDFVDYEDELELGSVQTLLSEHDPREVEQALNEALKDSLSKMQDDLRSKILELSASKQEGEKAMFLTRAIREIRQRLGFLRHNTSLVDLHDFGLSLIPSLHRILASSVSVTPVAQYAQSIGKFFPSENMPIRALWAGTPPLPVQPSPAVFRLLHTLVKQMAGCGADLWAKGAVEVLKVALTESVGDILRNVVTQLEGNRENTQQDGVEAETNPNEEADPQTTVDISDGVERQTSAPTVDGESSVARSSYGTADSTAHLSIELKREKLIQIFFDVLYLSKVLTSAQAPKEVDDALSSLLQSLEDDGPVTAAKLERLRKGAMDYWKKTYFLFGLLAL